MSIARRITQWKNAEIKAVLQTSNRLYKGPECDIRIAKTTNAVARLLLIVSRKTGSAPARNRFKRRLKALFYQEKLHQKGYDWIVFAKKEGLQIPFSQLKEIVQKVNRQL